MKLNDIFLFGQYKGLSLQDVYQGTLNIDRTFVKQYVEHMLLSDSQFEFFCNHFCHKNCALYHIIDYFEITKTTIKVFWINSEPWNSLSNDRIEIGNIEEFFEKYLSIGIIHGHFLGFGFDSAIDINKENVEKCTIGADPSYIVWCINELDHFFVDPNDLELMEKFKVTYLNGINVTYKGDSLYEYSPSTTRGNFSFTDEIKQKNLLKYEKIFFKNNCKSKDNNQDDDWDEDLTQEELENADWDYNPNNPAHDPSQNPWIDVFGPGDEAETAYWNTD